MIFYLAIILMILGTTFYHVAQKSVPAQVNPMFSLAMNYITALVGIGLLFFHEHLSARSLSGVILSVAELGLITQR
jgi:drug/metabolite transporter (DMT)-like permease